MHGNELSSDNEISNHPSIGWLLTCDAYNRSLAYEIDKQIAICCKKYGSYGFSFLTCPLGGMHRYFWKPERFKSMPEIHLPDLQLDTQFWQKYINCSLSDWIDLDSDEHWIATISLENFHREMDYARYLGISSVLLKLKHPDSPKLAEVIKNYSLSSSYQINFWIILSTDTSKLGISRNEQIDIWTIWRNFRSLCGNLGNLFVALSVSEDLHGEFNCDSILRLERWHAEPLICAIIDYSLFTCVSNGVVNLSLTERVLIKHSQLILNLLSHNEQHILLSSYASLLDESQEKLMLKSLRNLLSINKNLYKQKRFLGEYLDILQAPLQPLSDNLDSTVYQTFESDKTKYRYYQNGIRAAINDMVNGGFKEIVLIVLGAGRGPLVTASINAVEELRSKVRLKLYAVEKNENAILSLKYCNEEYWKNSVKVIHSDMRSLAPLLKSNVLERPDIIVSELLGSFGDNELAPECLDGVSCIAKDHTIYIPQSYKSYIAPIQSLRLQQCVQRMNLKYANATDKFSIPRAADCFYVVCMDNFFYLDKPQCCFEFLHPNKDVKSNSRLAKLKFKIPPNTEIMGFAGHFEVILYKNCSMNTHPLQHTEGLFSWFPALFPLRETHHIKDGKSITLHISRKLDENRCWYEWHIDFTDDDGVLKATEIQNMNGESQSMKLF